MEINRHRRQPASRLKRLLALLAKGATPPQPSAFKVDFVLISDVEFRQASTRADTA